MYQDFKAHDTTTGGDTLLGAPGSDAVDAKLTEQVKAGVFPVRLSNEDWVSGETVWLLDVIAADRKQATAVLANFTQLSGDKHVKVHPIVARSVEAGVLDKMRVHEEPLESSKR